MKKNPVIMTLLLALTATVYSQGYPGHYPIDDTFTRGILRNVFNMSHEAITFGVYWGDLTNTYYETTIHRNRLRNISSMNYNTTSPDVLIADYQNRLRTLNMQIMQITQTNKARIDRDMRYIGESVAQIARNNNITTGNANADWFIKELTIAAASENQKAKYEAELRRVQQEAQLELRRELKSKMDPIKESLIADNQKMYNDYLKAAAYEATEQKEKYFLECRKFHKCFIDEVNENYSIYNADWMNPKCAKPGIFYSTVLQNNNYAKIAFRKKELFDRYGNKEFLEATNLYLEAALAENNRDASAYFLKAQMEDDIILKKFYAMMANDLDKSDPNISSFTRKVNSRYTNDLFEAIRNGNYSFVSKSMKYKFHMGQTHKGQTPVEASIDADQSRIFKMILDDIDDRDEFLKSSGYALLFHAAAVNATSCLEQLSNFGVPMNYIDRGNNGVTPLNIAIINRSQDAANFLYAKVSDYSSALQFAAKSGNNDLNDLSLFLYKKSNSNIAVIGKYFPDFKYENYGAMQISATPSDASIYIDGSFKGKGNVKIEEMELGRDYSVEVKKAGLQTAKRDVTADKGKITVVKVFLQKPPESKLALKTHSSAGFGLKSYQDYYERPSNLKKDRKWNREFNDEQEAAARKIAQAEADEENIRIRKLLESTNSRIKAKNAEIARKNAKLESERLFEVRQIAVPVNSGKVHNAALLATNSRESLDRTVNDVDQKAKPSSKIGSNLVVVSPPVQSGVNLDTQTTVLKTETSGSSHLRKASNPEPISSNTRSGNETIRKTREVSSQIVKSPTERAPLFDIEMSGEDSELSVIRLIDRNLTVNFDKSSASVEIISFSGVKHNFSSTYENGKIEFYPFCGIGNYSISISLTATQEKGGTVRENIFKEIDVNVVPKNFVGLVARSMGSLLYIKPTEGCVLYPGMMVRAMRFNPQESSDVAAGRITFVGDHEVIIEVDQSFQQVQKGDLVTMK
jgi:hypothetical protein